MSITNEQLEAWSVRSDDAGRLAKALQEERAESLRQAEIARDALTEAERLRALLADAKNTIWDAVDSGYAAPKSVLAALAGEGDEPAPQGSVEDITQAIAGRNK